MEMNGKRLESFGRVLVVVGYILLVVLLAKLAMLAVEFVQNRNSVFAFMSFVKEKMVITALLAASTVMMIAIGHIMKGLAGLAESSLRTEQAIKALLSKGEKGEP
ncbi:MAG: hypothetical protein WC889_19935 [Myxococcota bacterium]|jgi:hypothetical protein